MTEMLHLAFQTFSIAPHKIGLNLLQKDKIANSEQRCSETIRCEEGTAVISDIPEFELWHSSFLAV